jgi:hypothetical protein
VVAAPAEVAEGAMDAGGQATVAAHEALEDHERMTRKTTATEGDRFVSLTMGPTVLYKNEGFILQATAGGESKFRGPKFCRLAHKMEIRAQFCMLSLEML